MIEPGSNLGDPASKPGASDIELWREAMAHLRHLSDDVWDGMRLFLVLNAFIFISIVALSSTRTPGTQRLVLLAILAVIGIMLTFTARFILKRHRIYYLQMLAK